MSNRKKYVKKLVSQEIQRKRRLKKKLRRQKILAGRRKNLLNKATSEAASNQVSTRR
ncbi:MAG: hypothetical protein OEV44_13790 [Spirochaetota bacterium]|nr:hypothetical protein [Spirochaetota bacterium]